MIRVIFFALGLCCALPAAADDLLVRNVTIVDAETASLRRGMDVVIDDGRITAVRPHRRSFTWRRRVIDGRGRYLIPGLWDMHVHLARLGESTFPLLVAMGVTSVRDLGGDPGNLADWRARIERGDLLGPRLRYCGPMLEGPGEYEANHEVVTDADAAHAIVARLADEGVDCIKVRSAADEATYRALAEAAHAAGLPLYGHAPFALDPMIGAQLGMQTFEHAFYPYPFETLPTEQKEAILAAFRQSGVALDPTLVAWVPSARAISDLDAELAALADGAAADEFVSPALFEKWRDAMEYHRSEGRGSPGWVRAIRQAGADVGAMFRAGVPVLAGTDLGSPFVHPETAIYEELELLVAHAGLTPAQALVAATSSPARLMGLEGEQGRVEPGMFADLVLINADPLADISAVRQVETVIYRGVAYDRAAREALRQQARDNIRALWRDRPSAPPVGP
jgi:imidazolonepropionase-like amidohydrolase